jgi:hypothetical protein
VATINKMAAESDAQEAASSLWRQHRAMRRACSTIFRSPHGYLFSTSGGPMLTLLEFRAGFNLLARQSGPVACQLPRA